MKITNLHQLFLHQLTDLYSAEHQIIKALPKMIDEASDEKLQTALQEHLDVTHRQLERLEKLSEDFDFMVKGFECAGMKGVITEAEEELKEITDNATKDAAIITLAQRVEHYEMAAYGGAVAFAKVMGHDEAADVLQQTLDEEADADKNLSKLAEGGIFRDGLNEEALNEMSENKQAEI